jgi:hypothetical protein
VWVVITCLWVILAFVFASPVKAISHRNDPIRISIGDDTIEFPSDTSRGTMRKVLIGLVKKENAEAMKRAPTSAEAFLEQRNPESEADNALTYFYAPRKSLATILLNWFGLTIFPPTTLLAIAFAVGWMGRGFVPTREG